MPYVGPLLRTELNKNPYAAVMPGDLNYVITLALRHALNKDPDCPHPEWEPESVRDIIWNYIASYVVKAGISYSTYNTVMGVLTCVVGEMKRREDKISKEELFKVVEVLGELADCYYRDVVGPYEDEKKEKNGDVY